MSVASGTVRAASPAKNPLIYNVVAPLIIGTEFSQLLDSGIKQFTLRARGSAKLQLSFITGETNINYITIEKNSCLTQTDLEANDLTVYLSCNIPGEVIEIIAWK